MASEFQPQQSPPANGALKRRQSEDNEAPEQESKRIRTDPSKASPQPTETTPVTTEAARRDSTDRPSEPSNARRKSSAVNEKDRSRRLFGGLLGSLSQKGDSRTAKRRQEIESRKKAELQQQDDQNLEDKQKRLEELAEKRRRVKKRMDEETMRNRHRNMLHSAHFLHTTAQPRLLYKPWELRDEEEDRIDDQISDTKAQIERELADHEQTSTTKAYSVNNEPPERTTAEAPQDDHATDTTSATADPAKESHLQPASEPTAEPAGDVRDESTNREDETKDAEKPASPADGKSQVDEADDVAEKAATTQQDEHDDHVVEGEEDTVIY